MYKLPIIQSFQRFKKLKAIWSLLISNNYTLITHDSYGRATYYIDNLNTDQAAAIASELGKASGALEQELTLSDYINILNPFNPNDFDSTY